MVSQIFFHLAVVDVRCIGGGFFLAARRCLKWADTFAATMLQHLTAALDTVEMLVLTHDVHLISEKMVFSWVLAETQRHFPIELNIGELGELGK